MAKRYEALVPEPLWNAVNGWTKTECAELIWDLACRCGWFDPLAFDEPEVEAKLIIVVDRLEQVRRAFKELHHGEQD